MFSYPQQPLAAEGLLQNTPALGLPPELTSYTDLTLLTGICGLTHREQAQDKSQKFTENFFLWNQTINQRSERRGQS